MPERAARVVDVRTSPVAERIAAIDDFVGAGYEVHFNFSPVIVYDGWEADYAALFESLDRTLSAAAKRQLKAEVIFLTHNAALHEVNLRWHPSAEDWPWRPELQQKTQPERHVEPALQSPRQTPLPGLVSCHPEADHALLRSALRILTCRRVSRMPSS